jgi:UDP-3-O-[3-hydroxymyristoyl] glucosamine N-acyltransferase
MLGAPATSAAEQLRIMTSMEKLPEMRKDLREIKKHLGLADT